MASRLKIEPLTPACGALITGADAGDLNDEELAELRDAVTNRCVVVLPGQFISPEDQSRLGHRLGEPLIPGAMPCLDNAPGVILLENNFKQTEAENFTNQWHADATHMPNPPSFTLLSCAQPAPIGGDTLWSSQYAAYEALSDSMKDLIRGRRIGFEVAAFYRQFRHPDDPIVTFHPIVRIHADTGRKSLFLTDPNRMTVIEGMTKEESLPITNFLHQHSQTPEFSYRHRWTKGDLVIWDNRCSMHYAVRDYDPNCVRDMNRLMIAGEIPIPEVSSTPRKEPVAA